MKDKERFDKLLVKQNFCKTRQKAQFLIKSGFVFVDGNVITKAGEFVKPDSIITFNTPDNIYVGRGGYKLEKALSVFDVNVKNKVCVDVGASTGGFTDCMLRYGAKIVYAVDIGHSQLDSSLVTNPKVISFENTDIRNLSNLPEPADFIAVDVSFISLLNILPSIKSLIKPSGDIIALIKPQFEAGKNNVGKNGIVKNPKIHISILNNIITKSSELGLYAKGLDFSPITGKDGNIEFLVHFSLSPPVLAYNPFDKDKITEIVTLAGNTL